MVFTPSVSAFVLATDGSVAARMKGSYAVFQARAVSHVALALVVAAVLVSEVDFALL